MLTASIVIPCYNEAARLKTVEFVDFLERNTNVTFCFVDDGSTDSTAEALAFLERQMPNITAVYLEHNRGKAEAVRAGIVRMLSLAQCDCVGYWDADLATPLEEVPRFLRVLEENPAMDAVIGTRWPHLGASIERKTSRGLIGSCMHALIRHYLRLPIHDTQCGAKLFRREIATRIFSTPFVSRWLFDVELFKRMGARAALYKIWEQPLQRWSDVDGSKLTTRESFRILFEIVRIVSFYHQHKDEYAMLLTASKGSAKHAITHH